VVRYGKVRAAPDTVPSEEALAQARSTMDLNHIETKEVGPVLLIRPIQSEFLDRHEISLSTDELEEYVSMAKPEKIVFSLKHMTKYSSQAIGGLVRVQRVVEKYGGRMKLAMTESIRELFRVTGLDGSVFEIFETESDAIASFFARGGDVFGGPR
jgi:anti-anti-sigma regulatory factor